MSCGCNPQWSRTETKSSDRSGLFHFQSALVSDLSLPSGIHHCLDLTHILQLPMSSSSYALGVHTQGIIREL